MAANSKNLEPGFASRIDNGSYVESLKGRIVYQILPDEFCRQEEFTGE